MRVLLHGGVRAVLGLEGHAGAIASEMSVWAGVVVMPSERAYARPDEGADVGADGDAEMRPAPAASAAAQSAAAAQVVAAAAATQPTQPAAVAGEDDK